MNKHLSMFQSSKNIDTAFRHVRSFSIAMVIASAGITIYALYSNQQAVKLSQQKIYILAAGKALEAIAADRKDNIPVEARDHVKTFHQYFFSLDPDDKVIQANISRALWLADASAKQQYNDLKENSYYAGIISGNISQSIDIDSISIHTSQYPFYFRCSAKEKIIRPSSITTRLLITEGWLRHTARSDNNPHGFLIEKWRIVSNPDLQTEKR